MKLASKFVEVERLRLHYREAGVGAPVLLLHGWPTSSLLWRDVMPPIAAGCRVIALDLPGFGESAKPLDASYSFRFHERVLTGFLDALGLDGPIGLAVHDLGGPIGLYWAVHHPARLAKLALLNTIVYPELSWAVAAFGLSARLPGVRDLMASPAGLKLAMRIGVADRRRLTDDAIRGVQAPFVSRDARRALRDNVKEFLEKNDDPFAEAAFAKSKSSLDGFVGSAKRPASRPTPRELRNEEGPPRRVRRSRQRLEKAGKSYKDVREVIEDEREGVESELK